MSSFTPIAGLRTAVVVLAAATATYLWLQYRDDDAPAVPRTTPNAIQRGPATPFASQVTRNEETLAALNAQIAAMAAQIASLKQQQASASSPDSNATSPALTAEEAQQRGDEQADAQAALIEQAVVAERADPNWAPAAETSIRRMFQDSEIESLKLMNAQCRATLCRIDIASNGSSPGAEDFDQSFRRLLVHMPWQAQGFGRVYNPFGPAPTAVFFLAREGNALPQPSS